MRVVPWGASAEVVPTALPFLARQASVPPSTAKGPGGSIRSSGTYDRRTTTTKRVRGWLDGPVRTDLRQRGGDALSETQRTRSVRSRRP